MLTVKCQSCGAVYKLSEDLYSRKAAGFGVVVTCRRCKAEIHVEAFGIGKGDADDEAEPIALTATKPATDGAAAAAERAASPAPPTAAEKAASPAPPAPAEKAASPAPPAPAEKAASPAPPAAAEKAASPLLSAAARKVSPSPPLVSAKATAPWPQAPTPSPAAAAAAPAAGGTPRPRAAVPRRDPGAGPFVALSPGLLAVHQPEPGPDSEAPVDSSDFIDDRKKGAPKAPPPRRTAEAPKPPPPKSEQKVAKAKRADALPLKLKEPPKPPPRAPVRTDDVSDDLLSADVGFDRAPRPVDTETPRILAPDSSALAAPPAEPEAQNESPKRLVTPTTSTRDAPSRPSKEKKSSRAIPLVLLSLGAAGAFALAFRSQMRDTEPPPAAEPVAAPAPPDKSPAPETPPALAPTPETAPAAEAAAATSTSQAPATAPADTTKAARPATDPSPRPATDATASSASTAKPGVTAAAPGAAVPAEPSPPKAEGPFDPEAARAALAAAVAQAGACRKPGDPTGVAAVTITFSPSGRVTSATIAGPPFAGTPTGGCIAATLRKARVPPFTGDLVTVRKTVEIH